MALQADAAKLPVFLYLRFPVLFALLSLALALPCAAQNHQDSDRAQAELKLGEVLEEIEKLRNQLENSRTEQRQEQARLEKLDLEIQQANHEFRALEQTRLEHVKQLGELERQREDYLDSLDQRMNQLAEQIRSSYRTGQQSRIKLVLNQDDPVKLGRMLAYYDFLNRAQVSRISGLKEALATLEQMQLSIDTELLRISSVQKEQQEVLEQLATQRENRQILLARLASQIDNEVSQLEELERNRRDLEALIERLADVLADIPPDLGSHAGVARLKGQLPMPVNGPVRHAFGQQRVGGLNWQGWLIGAAAGTDVSSIAYGRVAFADWLRGYGLLIIIDHGQGFMSLYGHNESLLKEAGAWVGPGDIISVVGSNPGSGQGLYFEIRREGKAIDPAAWLAR